MWNMDKSRRTSNLTTLSINVNKVQIAGLDTWEFFFPFHNVYHLKISKFKTTLAIDLYFINVPAEVCTAWMLLLILFQVTPERLVQVIQRKIYIYAFTKVIQRKDRKQYTFNLYLFEVISRKLLFLHQSSKEIFPMKISVLCLPLTSRQNTLYQSRIHMKAWVTAYCHFLFTV